MKITIVMGFFLPMPPVAGGATEKSWHRLAIEFVRRGHDVTIISRRWKGWPSTEVRDGVRHVRLRGHNHTRSRMRNLLHDGIWSLRAWLALPPADITIINAVALPILLGRFRRRAGRLVVMTGRMPKGQYRFYCSLDRVLAVSTPVRTAVESENPRLAARTLISGYPIDCSLLQKSGAPRVPGAPLTIGFVGRIHQEKGLELLVAALRELAARPGLPSWRALLCGPTEIGSGGSGPAYARKLRQELGQLPPSASWELREPRFNDAALAQLYREIDIFCYPSLAARGETFGVAVAEAMAAGAVPVVSALPCFGDFVRAGENGAIFDHTAGNAATQLASALAQLLLDAPRRKRLATAACATVQRYNFPDYADRLLADFSSLQ